ncbi:hypothetical protein RA27_22370 [Ruegeria sp. ANG-R]|uniref:hypothetical protein n=1 Tax=Ruegeria sp. ANG-R TaxID=1577903 RepID=UPI00057D5397|nr:hypothetical protein [Ruegeria sp. ANG-R]KIC36090.1 hypothetical protein RA27_22370 [Ruegeria sp. ANG-R]
MRMFTQSLLIAATVTATLAAVEPATALTADEKREKYRLASARDVSLKRQAVEVRLAYAAKCEAAYAAGEPMPELDIWFESDREIDTDLVDMTIDEIYEQEDLALDAYAESERAWKACALKFRKRDSGS